MPLKWNLVLKCYVSQFGSLSKMKATVQLAKFVHFCLFWYLRETYKVKFVQIFHILLFQHRFNYFRFTLTVWENGNYLPDAFRYVWEP